ncbi:MAG: energy transducer TonB [Pseudomonadota bacterium]
MAFALQGCISDTQVGRWSLAAPIAMAVALALTLLMEGLIRVDTVALEEDRSRTLPPFMPEVVEPDRPIARSRVEKLPQAVPPAAKPISPPGKSDLNLPPLDLPNPDPKFEPGLGDFRAPVINAHQTAKPIRPPMPAFPRRATTGGECQVYFSVDPVGRPFDISATCSSPIFERESIKAVSKALFVPSTDADGKARITNGLVYPLVYKMEE